MPDTRPTVRPGWLPDAKRRAAGLASFATLLTLTFLLGLAALAIDMALLAHQQRQLQAGCEAAALAGAAVLMDRSLLPDNLQSLEFPQPYDGPMTARQILLARAQAIRFASANRVAGKELSLRDNPKNAPDGNLVVGWIDAPTHSRSKLIPWRGEGPCNALHVQYQRSLSLRNAFTLRFGRWLGISSLAAQESATAAVDQRIYGFRPTRSNAVPLLPIMALPAGSPDAWLEQASAKATGERDRFGVQPPGDQIVPASDGVPEIVLRVPAAASSGPISGHMTTPTAWLLPIGRLDVDGALLAAQIREGIVNSDLAPFGGEFALREDNTLLIPAPESPSTAAMKHTHAALQAIVGQKRIVPLGEPVKQEGQIYYEVRDFAAGRVVDATLESDGSLRITLQPTLMQTPTALVRDGQPRSAWLGKLVVTQ